jgi:prolyl 4-hydroxylase
VLFLIFKWGRNPKDNTALNNKSYSNLTYKNIFKDLTEPEKYQVNSYPKYTEKGYSAIKLPNNLKNELKNFWYKNQSLKIREDIPKDFLWGTKNSGEVVANILTLQDHDPDLYEKVTLYSKKVLEEWSGIKNLKHNATYGIREYKRGAVLKMHVDAKNTHVLSLIIHIHQNVDKSWPLVIFDPQTKKEIKIYLDHDISCVLYEGGRIIHGRPYEFVGDSYANIFAHFSPPNFNI